MVADGNLENPTVICTTAALLLEQLVQVIKMLSLRIEPL